MDAFPIPKDLSLLPFDTKTLCARLLPRLKHIQTLRKWFNTPAIAGKTLAHNIHTHMELGPMEQLWLFMAHGAPLVALLGLFILSGRPSEELQTNNAKINVNDRSVCERQLTHYLESLAELENLGRLRFGELPISVEDFYDGSPNEFAKLVRSIYRVIQTLEGMIPPASILQGFTSSGIKLYQLPSDLPLKRREVLIKLKSREEKYLWDLRTVKNKFEELLVWLPRTKPNANVLTSVRSHLTYLGNIINYHNHIIDNVLEDELWDEYFDVTRGVCYLQGVRAYQSFCAEYAETISLLYDLCYRLDDSSDIDEQFDVTEISQLIKMLRVPVEYILSLPGYLSNIVKCTSPLDEGSYAFDSLCIVQFTFDTFCRQLLESMFQARSTHAVNQMLERAFVWDEPEPVTFGILLLDDYVQVSKRVASTGDRRLSTTADFDTFSCCTFLFEKQLLLCRCQEKKSRSVKSKSDRYSASHLAAEFSYPVQSWDVGPALRTSEQFVIHLSLPISSVTAIKNSIDFGKNSILLLWVENGAEKQIMIFFTDEKQARQWLTTLQQACARPKREARRADTLSSATPTTGVAPAEITGNTIPDLTGQLIKDSTFPAGRGGFADVWKCSWKPGRYSALHKDTPKVAVKVLQNYKATDLLQFNRTEKRLKHEIHVWQSLVHENIAPLLGTCTDFGPFQSMVSPWYEYGSLHNYIKQFKDEPKFSERVRLRLLSDIAIGLSHLHSFRIVHGDLTSMNVLIKDDGGACLCDFGLSTIVEDVHGQSFLSSILGGNVRWAAPEIFSFSEANNDSKALLSTSSDIYSFGCILLEVLSGQIPWHNIKNDALIIKQLTLNQRPERPTGTGCKYLTDDMWSFILDCWQSLPANRPSAASVKSRIFLLYCRSSQSPSMSSATRKQNLRQTFLTHIARESHEHFRRLTWPFINSRRPSFMEIRGSTI